MLKITSKKANLSLLVGIVVLALIAFIVIEFRPGDDGQMTNNNGVAGTAAAAQSYVTPEIPVAEDDDMVIGSTGSNLKVFVYEDYSSIFSARLADDLEKVRSEFGDKVAIYLRPYAKGSNLAVQSARAVACAASQGKGKEMRALVFSKLKSNQNLDPESPEYGRQIGLNTDSFLACLTNERKSGKIEQSASEAEAYQVYGAPTVFIGDEMVPGARPFEDYVDSEGQTVAGLKTLIARKVK